MSAIINQYCCKMNNKIENLRDLEFYGAYEYCVTICQKWLEQKPNNPELQELAKQLANVFFYTTYMQQQRNLYEKTFSEFRADKLRAVERARKTDKKCEELQTQLDKLQKLTQL